MVRDAARGERQLFVHAVAYRAIVACLDAMELTRADWPSLRMPRTLTASRVDHGGAVAARVHERRGARGVSGEREGKLTPGMLADLAVHSQDIFAVAPDALPKTRSAMTIVGGKVVWEAPPSP